MRFKTSVTKTRRGYEVLVLDTAATGDDTLAFDNYESTLLPKTRDEAQGLADEFKGRLRLENAQKAVR